MSCFFQNNPLKFYLFGLSFNVGKPFHLFFGAGAPGTKKTNAEATSADKPSFFRIRIADLIYRTKDGHLDA